MQQYFPALWMRNLKWGFYDNTYNFRPTIIWGDKTVKWYGTSETKWNLSGKNYIYCGLG